MRRARVRSSAGGSRGPSYGPPRAPCGHTGSLLGGIDGWLGPVSPICGQFVMLWHPSCGGPLGLPWRSPRLSYASFPE
eukprot:8072884-Pyramimonas_sp.AAC.1